MNAKLNWKEMGNYDNFVKSDLTKNKFNQNDKYEIIKFGTAGMRGIMGAGLDKINIITISLATRAYANYLLKNNKNIKKNGIVIAHDNRYNHKLFTKEIVKIFNYYGIKTYVMKNHEMLATPILSFLIRKLKAGGGINLTASHNPKEYNGFKIYNALGAQLSSNETKIISKLMNELDPFHKLKGLYKPEIIPEKYINEYINEVIKIKKNNHNNIKVVYSPMHGTGINIAPKLFKKMGVQTSYVDKQMIMDPDFSHTKSPNPENGKAYHQAIKKAKKTKSDLVLITDPDCDRVGAVVKYKKRYKYLSNNEISAIYLNYYLSYLKKNNKLPKDGYIVKSLVSTDLATQIADKYGIETREVNVGFKNVAELIENSKGTFLFAFEESYGLLINSNISRDKDAFQGITAIVDMAIYYKNKGITLFDQLKNIQKKFRIYRNVLKSEKINAKSTKRVLNGLSKTKEIYGKKVKKVIDFRKDKKSPQQMVKIFLNDGSWIVARPSGTEPKIKYYVQTIGKLHETLMHLVIMEKKFFEYIDELAEFFPPKKFSWKAVLKYSIFAVIVVGLLLMVFKLIYSSYSSNGDKVTSSALSWLNDQVRTIFLIGFAGIFFNIFINSWMKYRLLKFHKQNVKIRHLFISSIMGEIISYVTPLAIGGDAIGYWYLRRKGFKKAPLASTFLTGTILWQIKNIFLTAILLPMGITMFKDIFTSESIATKTVMYIFLIGLGWDIFSIIMLWTILFSKKFQEWSISTSIKLMEWFPWTHIYDPGGKASKFMAEFENLRNGMKTIWKSPKILLESLFYELVPKLFSISAIYLIMLGVIKEDLAYGKYWSQIVTSDVVNTANSFSLTPGSTGFIEFISLNLRNKIYVDSITGDSRDTVIYIDIAQKIILQWPYLLLSTILAISIIFGESREKLYKTSRKGIKKGTSFYKKISFIWPLYIAGWIILILFI